MKFSACVTLLVVILRNSAAELNAAHKLIIQAKFLTGGLGCLKEHPISLSDIKTFMNKMLPDGDDANCFAECLFKKIGIMDDQGMLSAAGARESAMQVFNNREEHLRDVEQYVQTCSSVNEHNLSEEGKKACGRAQLAFTCLVANAPKFGFNVDF